MLKVWHIAREGDAYGGSRNANKILLALDEIGEQCQVQGVSRADARDPQGALRKLNPNGLVPVVEDDGLVLWESGAILRYLGDTRRGTGLLPADAKAAALVQQWLSWEAATYAPSLHALFFALMADPSSEAAVDAARAAYLGQLRIVDAALAGREYLAGTFSVADIALGAMIPLSFVIGLDLKPCPHLLAWLRRLAARKAWQGNDIFTADMAAGAAQLN